MSLRHRTHSRGRAQRCRTLALGAIGAIGACALIAVGCATKVPKTPESPTAAVVGKHTITIGDVDDEIKQQLFDDQFPAGDSSRLFDAREAALDDLVDRQVVEQASVGSGLTPDAWLKQEAEKRYPVTEDEIDAFWQQYEHRLPKDRPEKDLRADIRAYLIEENEKEVLQELRQEARIRRVLARPRHEVAPRGEPKGPAGAPITIVEFSDFECPFCLRAIPTLQSLLEAYPDQIRLYYRHLPLPSHARARPAAIASVCAEQQGEFWAYHDVLFQHPRALSDADLRTYAEQLGLDMVRFDACLTSDEAAARVDEDMEAANELAVTGTPTFFVNGIRLRGAQPLAKFKRVVDQELAAMEQP